MFPATWIERIRVVKKILKHQAVAARTVGFYRFV